MRSVIKIKISGYGKAYPSLLLVTPLNRNGYIKKLPMNSSLELPDPTLCYMTGRPVWSTHCTSIHQEHQVSGKMVIEFITAVIISI